MKAGRRSLISRGFRADTIYIKLPMLNVSLLAMAFWGGWLADGSFHFDFKLSRHPFVRQCTLGFKLDAEEGVENIYTTHPGGLRRFRECDFNSQR